MCVTVHGWPASLFALLRGAPGEFLGGVTGRLAPAVPYGTSSCPHILESGMNT